MVGIISQSPINMPTADMPLTMGEDGKPTQIWWRFWFSLLRRTLQTIPNTTNNAVVATGTTQADAVPLDSEWNVVTTTPPGTGGALTAFGIGISTTVMNIGGNSLNVYPAFGFQIDALPLNTPYSLLNNKTQIFNQVSDTQFISTQLG